MLDTKKFRILAELIWRIFSSIMGYNILQVTDTLTFYYSFKYFENGKHFIFASEKVNPVIRIKSYTKRIKYLFSLKEVVLIGQQKSWWTNSIFYSNLQRLSLQSNHLWTLHNWYDPQTSLHMSIMGTSSTIPLYNIYNNEWRLQSSILLCWSHVSLNSTL